MTKVVGDWVTVWRLDRMTHNPEEVRVLPVGNQFVLVEGEDHTQYAGNFFPTPERAFQHKQEDIERTLRHYERELESLARARERFTKKGGTA